MNRTPPFVSVRKSPASQLILYAVMAVICLWLFEASARAQTGTRGKRQPITVVYGDNGFAPYYTQSLTNPRDLEYNGIGMFPDFLNAFATRYPQFRIKTIQLPRKRISEWVQNKNAQVISLSNPDIEPAQGYSFSLPLWNSTDYIVSRREDNFFYNDPYDLYGLHVGVILGNRYGELDTIMSAPEIKVTRVTTHCQLHDLLARNRVDVIIANRLTLLRSLKKRNLSLKKLRFSKAPVFSMQLSVMVRNDLEHFLNLLNGYISECQKNGTLDRIAEDWEKNTNFPENSICPKGGKSRKPQ